MGLAPHDDLPPPARWAPPLPPPTPAMPAAPDPTTSWRFDDAPWRTDDDAWSTAADPATVWPTDDTGLPAADGWSMDDDPGEGGDVVPSAVDVPPPPPHEPVFDRDALLKDSTETSGGRRRLLPVAVLVAVVVVGGVVAASRLLAPTSTPAASQPATGTGEPTGTGAPATGAAPMATDEPATVAPAGDGAPMPTPDPGSPLTSTTAPAPDTAALDRPGWVDFTAPDGSFRLRAPVRLDPVDASVRPGAFAVFQARTGSGTHAVVVAAAAPGTDPGSLTQTLLAGATVIEERAGAGGLDVIGERDGMRLRARLVVMDGRAYAFESTERPGADRAAEHEAFVASFSPS